MVADDNAAKAVEQIQGFLNEKVGGSSIATSPDPVALRPILQKFIWSRLRWHHRAAARDFAPQCAAI